MLLSRNMSPVYIHHTSAPCVAELTSEPLMRPPSSFSLEFLNPLHRNSRRPLNVMPRADPLFAKIKQVDVQINRQVNRLSPQNQTNILASRCLTNSNINSLRSRFEMQNRQQRFIYIYIYFFQIIEKQRIIIIA